MGILYIIPGHKFIIFNFLCAHYHGCVKEQTVFRARLAKLGSKPKFWGSNNLPKEDFYWHSQTVFFSNIFIGNENEKVVFLQASARQKPVRQETTVF